MEKLTKVDFVVIHHTNRNNDFPFFVKCRHKYLRGWEDIGYHYLIGNTRPFTKDGKIYVGRPEYLQGAHAFGRNGNSISICLIGRFDQRKPSKKQMASLIRLLLDIVRRYKIPIEHVVGHREIFDVKKSCPGAMVDLNFIRQIVRQNLSDNAKGKECEKWLIR